jgi:hypothetical protein
VKKLRFGQNFAISPAAEHRGYRILHLYTVHNIIIDTNKSQRGLVASANAQLPRAAAEHVRWHESEPRPALSAWEWKVMIQPENRQQWGRVVPTNPGKIPIKQENPKK